MLALSLSDVYEQIRDFFVAEERGAVRGACALHVIWDDLAEIRSLAVDPRHRNWGVGQALVRNCLEEARRLEIHQVFALTYRPKFFQKLGFTPVDKAQLPHKVWRDCLKCTKFPDCDETAVMRVLEW
jgi:amino-acid N-acetyltransferase